ncbi:hypothetical protein M407DRAFT_20305 [Tulasnella calospora MUT 4182]|uniref:Uncharacterized protein n=1 Tax=Tulasnella calospora MUT 4182 TaxID=1051891 RepID=A0A0C3QG70_9AGAM|nr:hypothetical protein M407DRAFT_20305 [Tulasnella calospora MUT 4182]
MSAHTNRDVLRSTLQELHHLWMDCTSLHSLDRSPVAEGGYGRIFVGEMGLPSQPPRKVAVKQLWSAFIAWDSALQGS